MKEDNPLIKKIDKPTFNDWFNTMQHNGDKLAAQLEYNLTGSLDFELPPIPWEDFEYPPELIEAIKKTPKKLTNEDLTTRRPGGTGTFDALMESSSKHILEEFEAGRITGAEYTKAYIACMQASMQFSVQFLTSQDTIYWQAINAQIAAFTAIVNLAIAKMELAAKRVSAHLMRANYALTKLKLATEDASFNMAVEGTEEKRASTQDNRLYDGRAMSGLLGAQIRKTREEIEATRAQTSDYRTDGDLVEGAIGMQNKLVKQQIKSFQDNSKLSYAKEVIGSFAVQKTADETLQPPSGLTSGSIDSALSATRSSIGL